ncbi:hypothetical protein KUL150_28810 [Alteromonas sp. KUL150]|uniref:DDE-type integrase/transposase/recombinase n=1 Tax=Alteromonas sp. KUL150 TaxID=2480805 RepID=UPI0012E493E4|nr:DDE-type integrase/transposase/recombinase [Alteromonas sp. KUL150]GFD86822.1 hypothetical protein KUL150_28810 [Alteromonas sp. KUL150]
MFQINDVFKMGDTLYRVLALPIDYVVLFNMDDKGAMPEIHKRNCLEEMAYDADLIRAEDPFLEHITAAEFASDSDKAIRDQRFSVIQNIVEDPEFFISSRRKELFKDAKSKFNKQAKFLWQICRLYWRKGLVPNALIGKYCNSGASGKTRNCNKPRVWRGKEGTGDEKPIAAVTPRTREHFDTVIKRHYLAQRKTFEQTHLKLQALYQTLYRDIADEDIPTINQLRQHYQMTYIEVEVLKQRIDKHKYEKDVKAKRSTVNTEVNGPADIFGTDATRAKIHLVSKKDRSLIVGKPTLILVKDVFSRMVMGWYLGFENPSYYSNVLAFASAISDKTSEYTEAGFETVPDGLLPVAICQKISGDKGELYTHRGETLRKNFGVTFTTSRSYGSDANGIIERALQSVEKSFEHDLPGIAQPPKAKKQGGKDSRLVANVTIEELREYVLEEILLHNQLADLSNSYDRDDDMPTGLPLTPISLWRWGIKNRMGTVRTVSKKNFLLTMLPRGMATASVKGFCFEGLYFWSERLEELGFFEKNRTIAPYDQLECIFDPSSMNNLVVILPGKKPEFVQCYLSDRSRYYRDCSLQEVKVLQRANRKTDEKTKKEHNNALIIREIRKDEFIKELKRKKPHSHLKSDAERLRDIPENRKAELAEERSERMQGGSIFEPVEGSKHQEHQDDALYNPEVAELLKNKRN